MYLLCIVHQCYPIRRMGGGMHLLTVIYYVRTYAYMSFCSHTRVFGEVSCMNLTKYSVLEYNYLVNEYICLIRKKGEG